MLSVVRGFLGLRVKYVSVPFNALRMAEKKRQMLSSHGHDGRSYERAWLSTLTSAPGLAEAGVG
jgi:hypothetical protein